MIVKFVRVLLVFLFTTVVELTLLLDLIVHGSLFLYHVSLGIYFVSIFFICILDNIVFKDVKWCGLIYTILFSLNIFLYLFLMSIFDHLDNVFGILLLPYWGLTFFTYLNGEVNLYVTFGIAVLSIASYFLGIKVFEWLFKNRQNE